MSRLAYEAVVALVHENNSSTFDTEVIVALIYKGSRFDANARSNDPNSTATGLMQITRTVVREVNRVRKFLYQHSAMYNASTNIEVGTKYLVICLERKGTISAALDYYGTGVGYSQTIVAAAQRLQRGDDPAQALREEIGK